MSKAIFINAITDKLPLLTVDELDEIRKVIFETESFKKYCGEPVPEEGIDLTNGYGA